MKTTATATFLSINWPKWQFFIKEACKDVGRALGNIFLLVLALIMYIPLFFIATPWKIYVSFAKDNRKVRDILKATGTFFFTLAIGVDQIGNVMFSGLFNSILLRTPKEYPFGKATETISEVLGWNNYLGNLTPAGDFLRRLVDFIDFTQKGHCEKAMLTGIAKASIKINRYKNSWINEETIENAKQFLAKYP